MKSKKCKACGEEFTPTQTFQKWCSTRCALELIDEKKEQKKRREIKAAKQKLKTKGDYMKEAQTAFNRYIRQRDIHLPCISCGRLHQGQWHAGHYRTTKAAPELRIGPDAEWNCHRQCAPCNNHKSGDIVNYRIELVKRIGADRVAWLEGPHELKRYTIEDLQAIKKKYNAKYRSLL